MHKHLFIQWVREEVGDCNSKGNISRRVDAANITKIALHMITKQILLESRDKVLVVIIIILY